MVRLAAVFALALVACTPIHGSGQDPAVLDAPGIAATAIPSAPTTAGAPAADRLVVHEWGTFTAVAGANGQLVPWRPLLAPSDLPSFVYTQSEDVEGLRLANKGHLTAPVRMETPVVYFYVGAPRTIDVRVGFVGGTITEWYPAADKSAGELHSDVIDWGTIELTPKADAVELQRERAPSHYYPARATDAAIVRRTADGRTEHEKFLFYRGVGRFGLEVTAELYENDLKLRDAAARPALLVHVTGGKVGFSVVENGAAKLPAATDDGDALVAALRERLLASGLYALEVDAMITTWRNEWLGDDGVRVLYLVDDETVRTRLPLTVTPAPDEIVRTIVGRIEILTEAQRVAAQRLVDRASSAADACTALAKRHARFAEPLALELDGPRADTVRACLAALPAR